MGTLGDVAVRVMDGKDVTRIAVAESRGLVQPPHVARDRDQIAKLVIGVLSHGAERIGNRKDLPPLVVRERRPRVEMTGTLVRYGLGQIACPLIVSVLRD